MDSVTKILVVDVIADSRFLLVRTILRVMPRAVVQECEDAEAAVMLARTDNPSAIVAHRCVGVDGITLVRMLREVNQQVPIVMVSGLDRTREALEAGATKCLKYEEWLRIGTLVSELVFPVAQANPTD